MRDGYNSGYVRCFDCKYMESYWKNNHVVYFQCKIRPEVVKKAWAARWRKCQYFTRSKGSPFERRYNIKTVNDK